MEDQAQAQTQTQTPPPTSPRTQCLERNHEPVRSRWTPKPEQILILESIFNSGMVNPPKDETVKIRKLLEKFGSVGDANVFYWFQNRRSRSRRRQRQIQANLVSSEQQQSSMVTRCVSGGGDGGSSSGGGGGGDGAIQYQDAAYTTATPGFVMQQPPSFFPLLQSLPPPPGSNSSSSSTSSRLGGADEIYPVSSQAASFPEIEQNPNSMPSSFQHLDTSKVHYEFGVITVFINGVPTEVESGPFNMKALFGEDLMLVHSSGVPVPLSESGVCALGLQHGESYFLVSRSI
ncbi:WUSCHEL-related homeobox 11-like isoform X2 [Cynara cardunculus var. scolymus]|uniref:WUSCHEL-related homeobox 11-like isoform X2 n=1 Tax=Cynara cardunculus var. scolymus TaxID=59895 RepID=UPI000D62D6C4|nr:WUSCHEL-related homeobox 11-like isoform X2 [Cynara cardunculus var. scolymus]